jgi:hypothetical protein
MITSMSFQNLNADTIDLNTSIYPVHDFNAEIPSRIEKRSRSGQDGVWPTYPYEEGMEITIEGAILADDSDDYQTKRSALSNTLRFKPAVKERRSGIFYVEFDNADEMYKVDVALDTLNIPRTGASPNYSEYRIVFYSFTPYYIGVVSLDPIYDV